MDEYLNGRTACEGCALCPNCGFWSDVGVDVPCGSENLELDFCVDWCRRYFLACRRCVKSYVAIDGPAYHVDERRFAEIQNWSVAPACLDCVQKCGCGQ